MPKVFMRSQEGNKLIFSYYKEDGSLWQSKEFQKIVKGSYAKLSLKQYDDYFGAKRWAEGNGYFIVDDAPLPHPDKLEGTPPEKLKKLKIDARLAKKAKLKETIKQEEKDLDKKLKVNSILMHHHKCLVKYCRGQYKRNLVDGIPEEILRCNRCGHKVERYMSPNQVKKIDRPK